jgi:hypothetical protein
VDLFIVAFAFRPIPFVCKRNKIRLKERADHFISRSQLTVSEVGHKSQIEA